MSVPTPFPNSDPTSGYAASPVQDPAAVQRAEARKHLEARRKIVSDLVSYVVINASSSSYGSLRALATSGPDG